MCVCVWVCIYYFHFLLLWTKISFDYRTPEWLKKMFATITKSERNGPVFRFFMDLGDAGMNYQPFYFHFLWSCPRNANF